MGRYFWRWDKDFNDHVLLVANIIPVVPEPSSLLMLLGGLAILPLFKRKESRNGGGAIVLQHNAFLVQW